MTGCLKKALADERLSPKEKERIEQLIETIAANRTAFFEAVKKALPASGCYPTKKN
jgi:hypothetical protein